MPVDACHFCSKLGSSHCANGCGRGGAGHLGANSTPWSKCRCRPNARTSFHCAEVSLDSLECGMLAGEEEGHQHVSLLSFSLINNGVHGPPTNIWKVDHKTFEQTAMLPPPPGTEWRPFNIAHLDTRSNALIPSTEMTVASRFSSTTPAMCGGCTRNRPSSRGHTGTVLCKPPLGNIKDVRFYVILNFGLLGRPLKEVRFTPPEIFVNVGPISLFQLFEALFWPKKRPNMLNIYPTENFCLFWAALLKMSGFTPY